VNAGDLYGARVRALDGAPEPVSACPVCRATTARARFAVEGVPERVVICEQCGLGRFHPMLGSDAIAALYPDTYYGEPGVKFHPWVERAVRWIGARHVRFLALGLAPGSRVLDVGCGRGVVLGALADCGLEVHGVEVSREATRGADDRAQLRIASDLARAGYPSAYFDQVLIWHVLEHLEKPRETFAEVRRILRPGGRLVVAVPNLASRQAIWSGAAWFHLDLPRHLYQFPLAALRRLLDETGFEPISDHHFSVRQNPFGWIKGALNRVDWLPRNGLYTLLHRRERTRPAPFDLRTRVLLLAAFALLGPLALAGSVWDALGKTGATVHVVALRRPR
jgi:2-polyprenyl-3-methyl-5-hydroxy-6-metoxy-1,4-benzoquinol methylase